MLIDVKTGHIDNVWHNENRIDPRKEKVYTHSMEAFLMNLWSFNCVIELDTDEAEYEATREGYEY